MGWIRCSLYFWESLSSLRAHQTINTIISKLVPEANPHLTLCSFVMIYTIRYLGQYWYAGLSFMGFYDIQVRTVSQLERVNTTSMECTVLRTKFLEQVLRTKIHQSANHIHTFWCWTWWHYEIIPRTKASDAELWCFFDVCLNMRLSKQSWGCWFEMPSHSLWCHCNEQELSGKMTWTPWLLMFWLLVSPAHQKNMVLTRQDEYTWEWISMTSIM